MIYLLCEYDVFTLPMSNQNTARSSISSKDRHLMNFWPIWARGTIQEVKFSANLLRHQERKQIPKIFKKQKNSLLLTDISMY